MTETRNILLIGRTGNGKSTVANVISNTSKFEESEYVDSETKDIQIEEIEIDEINYKIIDTVGFGDTDLTIQQVMNKLVDASHMLKEGLSQVLFVTSGKFTDEELVVFDLLRTVIFDEEVVNYTTIVRTRFPSFREPEVCDEDKKRMKKDKRAGIVNLCKNFIYVNNMTKEEEPTQNSREYSTLILNTHLRKCQEIYKPKNLDEMNERFSSYMTEKERMMKEMEELRRQGKLNEEELRKFKKNVESLEKEIASKMVQHVQEKNPGYFKKCGIWIGEGFTLVGEGMDNTVEMIGEGFTLIGEGLNNTVEKCEIM